MVATHILDDVTLIDFDGGQFILRNKQNMNAGAVIVYRYFNPSMTEPHNKSTSIVWYMPTMCVFVHASLSFGSILMVSERIGASFGNTHCLYDLLYCIPVLKGEQSPKKKQINSSYIYIDFNHMDFSHSER